jgi:D-threo-aldose 1-dehydrogenase
LLAGRFTLLDHSAFSSGFLDSCARRQVAVLAGGVFNSGFLAGGNNYNYSPASDALVERRNRLVTICARHGATLPAAALQFASAHPAVTSVVVGARSANEVSAIIQWSQNTVSDELWCEMNEGGLIPPVFG